MSLYHPGTNERVIKEALIFMPRKNGKTTFSAGLAWALSLYYRKSGSKCYIVGNALQQSMESFTFLKQNIESMGTEFQIRDNNIEHSLQRQFDQGSIYIRALAASADKQDSLNANLIIADELHAYKQPKQYNVMKEATKAYTNKLVIGISTAGDNPNGFLAKRIEYAEKVLAGTIEDDQLFIFIARAEKDGDLMDERQHRIANPNYGVTIRPADMRSDATQAMNDPQQRKDFLAKSLNIFTGATNTYFNLEEFIESDTKAEDKLGVKAYLEKNRSRYTNFGVVDMTKRKEIILEYLVKLPIRWYGGADLSKLHDLTASAIYGEYKDIAISITHSWFPITAAQAKADEDGIPLFGWKDDGWLTMCNDAIVNYADVVKWFADMRAKGFKIHQVSFDKKFGKEFFLLMQKAGFKMVDAPQYFWWKNIGFRRIEAKMKTKDFYYLGSEAFEYCVSNVHGIEKTDDMIQYEKIRPTQRIDIFDASVFASTSYVDDLELKAKAKNFIERL
jgi:phage terminase large subunit-like protein